MISKTNFRKILASMGLLSISVPATLTVAGCGVKTIVENKYQKIVEAISSTEYWINLPNKISKVSIINENINTPKFIKNKLNDKEIISNIEDNLFKFENITTNGRTLTNEDLVNEKEIQAEINFSYGTVKGKSKLQINTNWSSPTIENLRLLLIQNYNNAKSNEEKVKAFDQYADFNLNYLIKFYERNPFDATKDDWHKVPYFFTKKIEEKIQYDVEVNELQRNWSHFKFELGQAVLNTDNKTVTFNGQLVLYTTGETVWFTKEKTAISVKCII